MSFNDNRQATAEVSLSPASQDRKIGIGECPIELTLKGVREVPAVPFHENAISRLIKEIETFVTPSS